ncbi:HpcH/HpaI aldolase family protein [Paraburkholderia sp. HD33-4]|uniref:HpcH/HpaI aldolase family protein n=1 Tax=Paraburkholderia sp. HD33-4 TaxID=2883242 RepID=UPI001F1E65E7|nr:aldolase/citrate lyase family protein [Paraburkholderia sp. HD33-4]
MKNKLLDLLSDKTPFAGITLMCGSTRVTEILARSNFDFLMVDLQHGEFNKASATDSVRAIAATGTVPLGRVADNAPGAINDLLDAGVLGVVVPMINSRDDAERAVRAAFYAPDGKRSKGGSAPIIFGDDYATHANNQILLVVMIETQEAVQNAAEILAVPGVGMCLIGTSDLAYDMGCERNGPEIKQALAKVINAGRKANVPVGTAIGEVSDIATVEELAPAFYLISHDQGLLKKAGGDLSASLLKAMKRTTQSKA